MTFLYHDKSEKASKLFTCVKFPPVNVFEKRMCSDFITAIVLEAHPLINLFGQQTVTQRLGVFTEVVWIGHHAGQHALLHLISFDLSRRQTNLLSAHLSCKLHHF